MGPDSSNTNGHDAGNGFGGDAAVSLETLDAKLSIVITKVDILERDDETVWDRLDELRRGQVEVINGQKLILNTLTNEVLAMKKTEQTKASPSRRARFVMAFTGGIAGGLAGGAVVTLLLKLGALSHNTAALAFLDIFSGR